MNEAEAFDERINEREYFGWVPDIRNARHCEYFYNNPWREPYIVQHVMGNHLKFVLKHLTGKSVLDIGCGAGQYTLEMAREGYEVTGVDISPSSIALAKRTCKGEDIKLDYQNINIMGRVNNGAKFDNIVFIGALHHFENVPEVLEHVTKWLRPQGRIILVEPARDNYTMTEAMFIYLVRAMLSIDGVWFQDVPPDIFETLDEFVTATDKHEQEQSPEDNSCTSDYMLKEMYKITTPIDYEESDCFIDRVGGGIRGDNKEALFSFLASFDQKARELGVLKGGGFRYVGELK